MLSKQIYELLDNLVEAERPQLVGDVEARIDQIQELKRIAILHTQILDIARAKVEAQDKQITSLTKQLTALTERIAKVGTASERLYVGLTRRSTPECSWYEGIEHDAILELRAATRPDQEPE